LVILLCGCPACFFPVGRFFNLTITHTAYQRHNSLHQTCFPLMILLLSLTRLLVSAHLEGSSHRSGLIQRVIRPARLTPPRRSPAAHLLQRGVVCHGPRAAKAPGAATSTMGAPRHGRPHPCSNSTEPRSCSTGYVASCTLASLSPRAARRRRAPCQRASISSKQQLDVAFENVCCKHLFQLLCFRGMLEAFYMDVAKVDRDVAVVVHLCCKILFPMFHLFSECMVQVCLFGC
jgi:hypothetical protein